MPQLDRRRLLAAMATGLLVPPRPAFASPSANEFGERLARVQQQGRVNGLHAIVVSQGGKLVFEHYATAEDENWDGVRATIAFAPDVLHDLRSVSKSVVGLLYGVALADGKVPPPEAKLYDQFPEYSDLARQDGRDRLTLHHVLSMTLGFEWDELTIPYGDPRNSENAMEAAPDRFRFILERPIAGEPGVKWTYCGGATALLGRLIARGTGEPLLDYARRVLFDPLGCGAAEWTKGDDGEPHAASGLRLVPRDMARIGQLALAGGAWNGRQIVPAGWVKRATTPVVPSRNRFYGYHWYMGDIVAGTPPRPHRWIGGIGWGGQQLLAFPELDLVIAITCGNYGKSGMEQGMVVDTLIREVVLPAFV
jgi:CubicO group peptidase (beta-lactamase class C family)